MPWITKEDDTPLSTGDRLGCSEIPDPLGAGGMGEEHRARDTELERDIPAKMLQEAVSQPLDLQRCVP